MRLKIKVIKCAAMQLGRRNIKKSARKWANTQKRRENMMIKSMKTNDWSGYANGTKKVWKRKYHKVEKEDPDEYQNIQFTI